MSRRALHAGSLLALLALAVMPSPTDFPPAPPSPPVLSGSLTKEERKDRQARRKAANKKRRR
jgi:hypothetical protein